MSENDDRKLPRLIKKIFTVGTPECAVFAAVVALVLAVLILAIGLGKTLLVALFIAAGIFIGGVPDKKERFRKLINRLFPGKNSETYDREAYMRELNRELPGRGRVPENAEENTAETEE